MKILTTFTLTLAASAAIASAASDDFDKAKPGALPHGWTGTQTGGGNPKWTVEQDGSAPSRPNVLKQGGEAKYPVAVKNDTNLRDGHMEV